MFYHCNQFIAFEALAWSHNSTSGEIPVVIPLHWITNKHARTTRVLLLVCYSSSISNPLKNAGVSVNWPFCTRSWTNMWRCRWIISIWFCVTDLSKDLLPSRSSRYLAVPQLGSRSPLLQERLLSGTHYQIPSPRWIRYHPSEASCLLYRARRRAFHRRNIRRSLAIIIQIQIQMQNVRNCRVLEYSSIR